MEYEQTSKRRSRAYPSHSSHALYADDRVNNKQRREKMADHCSVYSQDKKTHGTKFRVKASSKTNVDMIPTTTIQSLLFRDVRAHTNTHAHTHTFAHGRTKTVQSFPKKSCQRKWLVIQTEEQLLFTTRFFPLIPVSRSFSQYIAISTNLQENI